MDLIMQSMKKKDSPEQSPLVKLFRKQCDNYELTTDEINGLTTDFSLIEASKETVLGKERKNMLNLDFLIHKLCVRKNIYHVPPKVFVSDRNNIYHGEAWKRAELALSS